MRSDLVGKAIRRSFQFQTGICTGINDSGKLSIATGGRPDQRTGVANAGDVYMAAGFPALMATMGGRDMPTCLGRSGWFTG